MRTRRKVLLGVLIILALLGVGFHLWLNTGPLRRSVLHELSQYYDGRVELDRVSVRLNRGLVLRGLRFHATPHEKSAVLCEIPQVELRGSIWDLARGRFHSTSVAVRKPKVRVVQGADGQWRFEPPFRPRRRDSIQRLVQIDVINASLELVGREPSTSRTIQQIDLNVVPADTAGLVSITGKIHDPVLGGWSSRGSVNLATGQFKTHMQCPVLRLTPGLLASFGPAFDQFRRSHDIAGDVAIEGDLHGSLDGSSPLAYQIFVDPRNARLSLAPIPEQLRDLTGRIELTREQVRVHGLSGDLAGGQLVASGTLQRGAHEWLTLSLDVRHIDIRRLIPSGPSADQLRSAVDAAESISGKFEVQGLKDPDSWTGSFDGSLAIQGDGSLRSVPVHLSMSRGFLRLDSFEWHWDGGLLTLSANIPIYAHREIHGTARLTDVPLEAVGPVLSPHLHDVGGRVRGQIDFKVPLSLASDLQAWELTGSLHADDLAARHLDFRSITASVSARNGVITVGDVSGSFRNCSFVAQGKVSIIEPHEFSAEFRMKPVPVQELSGDGMEHHARGILELTGTAAGRFGSGAITVKGAGVIAQFAIGSIELGDTEFDYDWSGEMLRVSGLDVPLCGGRVRGTARWQPSNAQSGVPGRAGLTFDSPRIAFLAAFDHIDAAQLARKAAIPELDVQGTVSGEMQLQFDLDSPQDSLALTGRLTSPRLTAGDIPFDLLADFEYDGKTIASPAFSANIPAGRVTGSAKLELSARQRLLTVELQSTNLNLFKLAASTPSATPIPLVTGTAAGQISLQYDLASGDVTGQGAGRIQSLAIPDLPVIESILARRLEIRNDRILIPEYHATLWGGSCTGSCQINLHPDSVKLLELTISRLTQVDMARLSANWPATVARPSGRLSGTGQLYVTGSGRRQAVFGSGECTVESAGYLGMPLGRAVGSLEAFDAVTHEYVGGRVQPRRTPLPAKATNQHIAIRLRESHPARGMMHGTIVVGLTGLVTYDTSLRFSGLDLANVIHTLFATPYGVTGVLSGEVRLAGTERGPDDAEADMWFRVDNGNLWRFPVLAVFIRESSRALNRLLNLNLTEQGAQTAVARHVTLKNSTIQIHEFWISGDVGRLFGEGTVGLDGSIDLDFVGNFDTGLPKNVPLIGQLNGALNFLQQRLVKIHVSGTLSDPVAMPVPFQDLTQPAERFFRGVITGTLFDEP